MMGIPAYVAEEFDPKVRSRGHEYFISGDVRILEAQPGLIRARVHGSRFYTVTIRYDSHGADFDCDCPYSNEWGSSCKHVWATLLKAKSEGMVELDVDSNGESEFGGDDDESDAETTT